MNDRLSDYLPSAVRSGFRLDVIDELKLPPIRPRKATETEVARLKGDWERLEIIGVKARHPELALRYVEQARRTLMRAYDLGERDPRLLAVIGLLFCDIGDDATARPHLEAAVADGVVRPRVYQELARIRFAEGRAAPAGDQGRLSEMQVREVLVLLNQARKQAPPLAGVYLLTGAVWGQSAVAPTRDELAVLGEGVRLHPHDLKMIFNAAVLYAHHGFTEEATAFLEQGLREAGDTPMQRSFERLRAALLATPGKRGASPAGLE